MQEFKDEGNILRWNDQNLIQLKLKGETRFLTIGSFKDGVFRKTTHHRFKRFNAFGFCHKAIEVLNPQRIEVLYSKVKYSISRDEFDKHKQFLHFKKEGYELQCFVPIDKFENNI